VRLKPYDLLGKSGRCARRSQSASKDDNDKKTLARVVIAHVQNRMRVTLRGFRRHVGMLEAVGQREHARRLTQDYLAAYVHGLNQYVLDLRRMTITRRATRFVKKESPS